MAHHSITFCLLAVLALLPGVARAAGGCAGSAPQVSVTGTLPEPSYRHQLRHSQIGALAGRGHMTSDTSHKGLTQAETRLHVPPATFEIVPVGNGTVCINLKRLDVVWQMARFQVDVAAEYRPDSCAYRETLRHENEHVAIFRRLFREAERNLRQDMTEVARRTLPIRVLEADAKRTVDEVARKIAAAAKAAVARYERDARRENGTIDTQASYRAVMARCRDW